MGQRRGSDVDDAARCRDRRTGFEATAYRDQRWLRFVSAEAAMHAAASTNCVLLLGKSHRHGGQAGNAVAVGALALCHIDGKEIVAGDLAQLGKVFAGDDAARPGLCAEPETISARRDNALPPK